MVKQNIQLTEYEVGRFALYEVKSGRDLLGGGASGAMAPTTFLHLLCNLAPLA